MNAIRLKIMVKATKLRMDVGESLEEILSGWPALSDADKNQIRNAVNPE